MRRVLIFGNSGSGKSTLAKKLCAAEHLSHLDLDTLAWDAAMPPARKALVDSTEEIMRFITSREGWVIEGCYGDLLEKPLLYATEIVYLNLPIDACLSNARNRPWEPHKYSSKAAQDANLPMLSEWISQYYLRRDTFSQQTHQQLFDAFQGKKTMYIGNEQTS